MTSVLILSDTQLGAGKHLAADRLADQEAVLDQVADLADAEGVDLVLHLGDVHDSRTPSEEARLVFRNFARRVSLLRRFVVIAGNHDLRGTAGASPVDQHDDCYDFVREPRVVLAGDLAVACLPWAAPGRYVASRNGGNRDQLNAEIAELLVQAARDLRESIGDMRCILALHWAISGASLPTGLPVEMAREPIVPLVDLLGLGFDAIAAGHIHKEQTLSHVPLAFYAGSPSVTDWGEADLDHGVWLYNTDTPEAVRFEPLSDRRFVTVEVDLTEGESTTNGIPLDETDLIASAISERFPLVDATVRVRVRCTAEQARRIDWAPLRRSLEEPVLEGGAGLHKLVIAPPDIERVERARVVGVDETLSPLEALDLWLDHNETDRGDALRILTGELVEEVIA